MHVGNLVDASLRVEDEGRVRGALQGEGATYVTVQQVATINFTQHLLPLLLLHNKRTSHITSNYTS
jgi:hypothetical protein